MYGYVQQISPKNKPISVNTDTRSNHSDVKEFLQYKKWVEDEIIICRESLYMDDHQIKKHLKRHAPIFDVTDGAAEMIIKNRIGL